MRSSLFGLLSAACVFNATWTSDATPLKLVATGGDCSLEGAANAPCVHREPIYNSSKAQALDAREAVDLSCERQLRPVGRLGSTTAFLVSPCYILTAYHSVFGFAPAQERRLTVEFRVTDNVEDGRPSYNAVTAVPEVWGEGHIQSAVREDWVLLRLSECVGKQIGWMEVEDGEDDADLTNKPVGIAGYPNDKPKNLLWRDRTGHIISRGSGVFRDCLLNSAAT
jgi:hypothetical protein